MQNRKLHNLSPLAEMVKNLPNISKTLNSVLKYCRNCKPYRRLQMNNFVGVFILHSMSVRIQSNLDSSNTDGSFIMANSNSVLSPYKILPIALKNKYLGEFSYFITKLYCMLCVLIRIA